MNGQVKALIPALIGIVTLLLTGITGIVNVPGEKQAVAIAETRAITLEEHSRQKLGAEFRADADAAARDMWIGMKPEPKAQHFASANEQG